jgi:hypothetical protein
MKSAKNRFRLKLQQREGSGSPDLENFPKKFDSSQSHDAHEDRTSRIPVVKTENSYLLHMQLPLHINK